MISKLKTDLARRCVEKSELADIYEKVVAGDRLSREDGLRLFQSNDLLAIGFLANLVRERFHGEKTYWVYNQHINYSNICINGCRFCAYSRQQGEEGGFLLTVDQVATKVKERLHEPITEIHVVGGCHPDLPFSYYLDLVREIKKMRPESVIKAFTAVEVAHLAHNERLSVSEVLQALKEAGVQVLPGGGAEVFSNRVRQLLCPEKLNSDGWLQVAKEAHLIGMRSNATLLYGHLETAAERVDHMLALREAQDETGGFITFIPLAFQTANTGLSGVQPRTGFTDLKTIAVSRLLLDNFAHIKAYWIMLGAKMAQIALHFGADDLDGTVMEERIGHMAGAQSAEALTPDELQGLIRAAGREPVERDTFFRPVAETGRARGESTGSFVMDDVLDSILEKAWEGERLTREEGLLLWENVDFYTLAALANNYRLRLHPEPVVTYVSDRNINYTNICLSGCRFCAFYRPPEAEGGYVLSHQELAAKIEETLALGGTQILLQGGLHPGLRLSYYEEMLQFIKDRFPIHIHGLSPPEIIHLARTEGLGLEAVIKRLQQSGLDSIPGGGAEILADEIRSEISPNKCSSAEWLEVMECAHSLGMKTTATMMFGHIETVGHRLEHLLKLRELQDRTGGFTAFIPWTFQPDNTALKTKPATAMDYLRTLAMSRLVLDNIQNLQVSWVTMGAGVAQVALQFGANDFGSTMIEENVVAAAGVRHRLSVEEIRRIITDAGYEARQRNMSYEFIEEHRA